MNTRRIFLVTALGLLALAVVMPGLFGAAAEAGKQDLINAPRSGGVRPPEKDVRGGAHGVPKSPVARALSETQTKSLKALQAEVGGAPLVVQYNALTNTPRHLFSRAGYLTPPTGGDAESIARNFLKRWQGIFRFTDADLDSLKIKSRSLIPDLGTDVLVFEQQVGGVPVYKGEVLVNVNREGRVLSVGSESFPQLKVTNAVAITPAAAIEYAARDMGLSGYNGQSLGATRVLATYGKPKVRYIEGHKFSGGTLFTDDIVVTRTVFPLGAEAREAYKFNLTTPQFSGIVWENVVDAETGEVLHRFSLTMFQGATKKEKGKASTRPTLPSFGPPGGGPITSRRSSFRPDVQDLVESFNPAGTAQAKIFDAAPTGLSGRRGFGRALTRGTRPGYRVDEPIPPAPQPVTVARNSGRGFGENMVRARTENPYSTAAGALFPVIYNTPFGQVLRGMPDAANPNAFSPFGWYYLPTGTGGAEITEDDTGRASTRNYGYTMADEAKRRNVPENAPVPCTGTLPTRDCDQPFSATLTTLAGAPRVLPDGRSLSSVFQSNYTEGNNVLVSDDRANDDETTNGIRGYDPNRQFTAARFDFTNSYEFGTQDATAVGPGGGDCLPLVGPCDVVFPASADTDIFPGTLSLFYYNNIVHDYLYSLGFTEALFNFQQDNFGRGGAGRDGVVAQVQDGSGTDNANMSPSTEGSKPRMQMYVFTETGFRRTDGSFDFDVVAHEHMHGINNRAVGKGDTGCVGNGLAGESGGQGEGWGDYLACSMADDDVEGEYATGEYDIGIRRIPYTNYRWSYNSLNGQGLTRRDRSYNPAAIPDLNPGAIPFEVHDGGEYWAATLWDMRELLIMKQKVGAAYPGIFFDGTRRLGTGTTFYIGDRAVQSIDTKHPIEYRPEFNTHVQGLDPTVPPDPNIIASQHIVRPGAVAAEIQTSGNRNGALSTAVRRGAFLSDLLMMRGMQLSPCNPTFVDSRDSILLADRERFGGENHAIIWRAFASHGVGLLATSSSNGGAGGTVVEDFSVPAGVTSCEQLGPLAAPAFALTNTIANTATITISPVAGAARFIISRAESANGPFVTIADVPANPATPTVYNDNDGGQNLVLNKTYFYQVRAARDAEMNCVSGALTQSITITVGVVVKPAPIFTGVNEVFDPEACSLLVVGWGPATSLNPTADIVYDIYRSETANDPGPTVENPNNPSDAPLEPTFEPTAQNRIATGVRGTSYTDTTVKRNRVYYYIVQARDVDAGKIDTNDTGNRRVKFNASSSPGITNTPVFAFEDFEEGEAGQDDSNARFTPPLVDAGNDPKAEIPNFQRVTGVQVSTGSETGVVTSMMYGPDFNPGDSAANCGSEGGGQSDFSTTIGPVTLSSDSVMEFDHFFITEAAFDGGVMEIKIGGDATFNSTPFPDNVTTFDLGNFIVEGGYNGRLNGDLPEVPQDGSTLLGRRAYTGAKATLHHVRIPLEAFAPGGMHNPTGLPVRIRFRMVSDVASVPACNAGWFIDNLAINNLDPAACPTVGAIGIGDLIISEFRLRGTNGENDEFIELYNKTNSPIIVSAFDGSAGFTLAAPNTSGVLTALATIPTGATIPARGHYLIANNAASGYSLSNYGGTDKAAPDATYAADIPDTSGIALFRTSTPANFTLANRLDAAGFSSADPLYREGAGLAPIGTTNAEYSHVRNLTSGFPQDTNQNAADFLLVHTTGAVLNGVQSVLGAPGPENRFSPIQRNAQVKASLIDPGCAGGGSATSACARVRTGAGANPQNAAFGTLLIRRRFRNTTLEPVRQLRFRAVNITTLGSRQAGEADLRMLSSTDVEATDSNGNPIIIEGVTLEENPPAQPNGGGLNSTVRLSRITMGTPLAPGAAVNLQFRLGVMIDGGFRFLVNVEALP
ncbi:MAG TPA: M36 family metallopeptidase [Pyrinomonadaceae bacterium]|jgi:hypothetical protein|nr:M36 family metallopeptidase [Pyrinomonadaceae bacterium]